MKKAYPSTPRGSPTAKEKLHIVAEGVAAFNLPAHTAAHRAAVANFAAVKLEEDPK